VGRGSHGGFSKLSVVDRKGGKVVFGIGFFFDRGESLDHNVRSLRIESFSLCDGVRVSLSLISR